MMKIYKRSAPNNEKMWYYDEKYFSERQFSYNIIIILKTQKVRSTTSPEGSRLVRIAVLCAQVSVAILCFERPAKQGTEPQVKWEARFVLCHAFR